jgi:3-methyladenine DNA glycosylase AlkD
MTASKKPSASRTARETISRLRSLANAEKAASYQRWFKEPVNYYGLGSADANQIKQDLIDLAQEFWTIEDAVRFCDLMVKDEHMEPRGISYQVVASLAHTAPPELLGSIRRWLETTCGNWGLVDGLAPSALSPLLERHPDLIPEVVAWTESDILWLRRGAVVAFVPLVKQKKFLPTAYRIVGRLLDDKEDLMHKAMGWLLREAGKTDTPRLEKFLLKHGPRIPRTTVRYALEKFPKEDRKRLMSQTKGLPAGKATKTKKK